MLQPKRLLAVLERLGGNAPAELPGQLLNAYSEPHRHYHNGAHIAECLKLLDRYSREAERPDEIELAIWFHDAVYETRKSDNEEASAEWAQVALKSAGLAQDLVGRVVEMVLATKNHVGPNGDVQIMLDIDLSILGADPEAFRAYDEAIRKEYFWVPMADYRAGREKVLRSFLTRPSIFNTGQFRAAFEIRARENLSAALKGLGA